MDSRGAETERHVRAHVHAHTEDRGKSSAAAAAPAHMTQGGEGVASRLSRQLQPHYISMSSVPATSERVSDAVWGHGFILLGK